MSSYYSANQYESAFKSQKLQNWTVPKRWKVKPSKAGGHTTFIANDRGHLIPVVRAKCGSAWPEFMGTWHLPAHLPPSSFNFTARSEEGRQRFTHLYTRSHDHSVPDQYKDATPPTAADGPPDGNQVRLIIPDIQLHLKYLCGLAIM
ncbi:hypothetical protein UPYG_G00000780 [Umbra pygmaea]|uniref:Protein Flattop n=1 Tax=Umbra pygmaea TaxID=75934 RepID=A0ABD0XG91_UMBPY